MARLTTRFWVDAYLARLRLQDIPAFVVAHGDDTGGAVLVKLATLDGAARLFQRSFDLMSGERRWVELTSGAEPEVMPPYPGSAGSTRTSGSSRWRTGRGRHLLEEEGLA